MTPREGLARIRAVRATLDADPERWPEMMRDTRPNSPGCILQRAAGCDYESRLGYASALGLTFTYLNSWRPIASAYDRRDPVALDAAIEALAREVGE